MNPETYTIYITDGYGMSEKATIKQTDLELALKDALFRTVNKSERDNSAMANLLEVIMRSEI